MKSLAFNLEHTSDERLQERQVALEREALELTLIKIHEQVGVRGIDTFDTGKAQTSEWLPILAKGINDWVLEVKSRKGRKPDAYKYISVLQPEVLAYVTARSVLQCLTNEVTPLALLATGIGSMTRNLVEFELLSKTDKDTAKALEHRLKYTKPHNREPLLRAALDNADFEGFNWTPEDRAAIGVKLIELTETLTGYVKTRLIWQKKESTRVVDITEKAVTWLNNSEQREALMAVLRYPMIVPPIPWSTPYNGGYLDRQINPLDLVLSKQKIVNRRLEGVHMPKVYSAVNALQSTPWRVNKRMLDVLEFYSELDPSIANLPTDIPMPLPDKPWREGIEEVEISLWIEFNPDEWATWKRQASLVHSANTRSLAKHYSLIQCLDLGKKFKNERAIYFPVCLDYRGRIYSMAASGAMNPQSNDLGKSLLHFAAASPLGEHGGYWLAIEVANTWGEDKLALDDRVQWAVDNTNDILSYASDPYQNRGWLKADKPWCFLAACFEWYGFVKYGDEFESRISVSLDGSTSGLQHFGAMLLDQETLVNTNVIQVEEVPTDMYSKVSEAVLAAVHLDECPMAKEWRTRIRRQICKTPSMTKAYGVSKAGMVDQIVTDSQALIDKGVIEPFESLKASASYLAPLVDDAITSKVRAATVAMAWLKGVSILCSEAVLPMRWTTQSGLEVVMDYKKSTTHRLSLLYKGERLRVSLIKDTAVIDKRRAAQAAAPCYVHSLDADHLISTVNMAVENDIDTFACIHDSFSCHASDTAELWTILRYTFWKQYSGNVLMDLYTEIREQLPDEFKDKLELPPSQGTADLSQVMNSDFFFA